MKLLIENTQNFEILSSNDLGKIIPPALNGKVLNYGQGEAQVVIDDTILGMYYAEKEHYCLQYEEGSADWGSFKELLETTLGQIQSEFGPGLKFTIKGSLDNS